jgi:hypothetical protein
MSFIGILSGIRWTELSRQALCATVSRCAIISKGEGHRRDGGARAEHGSRGRSWGIAVTGEPGRLQLTSASSDSW